MSERSLLRQAIETVIGSHTDSNKETLIQLTNSAYNLGVASMAQRVADLEAEAAQRRTWTPFNMNNHVRVRLTPHGRALARKATGEPPIENKDGWSVWQMWYLMEMFGGEIGMGCEPPFEMDIEFQ